MIMITFMLLLLVGFSSAAMDNQASCSTLKGSWYNEQDSNMTITDDIQGVLIGIYQTGVSSTPPLPLPSPLIGSSSTTDHTDTSSRPANAIFGATVVWKEFNSVTSWTGQCSVSNGHEILETIWILTSRVTKPSQLWGANNVGKDVFTRTPQKIPQYKEEESATRNKL